MPQYYLPELCAWCGVNKSEKVRQIFSTSTKTKNYIVVKKHQHTHTEFSLPICNECSQKLEAIKNKSSAPFWTGIILGSLFIIINAILVQDFTCLGGLLFVGPVLGIIFDEIQKVLTGYHSFNKDSWGTYAHGKFHFKSKVFAARFFELNPHLDQ